MSTHHHHHSSLSIVGVLSETKRIINAHSRHFLALSVLFLLPLSFSFIVVYPVISLSDPSSSNSILSIFHYHDSLFFISTPQNDSNPPNLLIFPILLGVFVTLLSLCATASITYSTFHGFYGRPVRFISSIKSILLHFLPLVATLIVTHLILGLIVLVGFGGFVVTTGMDVATLDISDSNNVYSLGFACVIEVFILCVLVLLQVEWCLSSVVVVVEGRWGFAALRRSSYLLGGMRGVAFSMIVLFGVLVGVLGVLCSSLVPSIGGGISEGWVSWAFVLQTVVYTGFITILMLYSVAGTAVLFMYCKALQGELALEIAEEFSHEYVSLPFDDGKVPHVVYVA